MRLATLLCATLLLASTAWADADVPLIRLGEAPPPPPAADPAKIHAVECFLAARQEASASRIRTAALRRGLAGTRQFDDDVLVGPRGAMLLAFDFGDADVPARGERVSRFTLPVHLLFAKDDGEVVETRAEELTFVAAAGGWSCSDIVPTDVVSWDVSGTIDGANAAGIGTELGALRERLRGAKGSNKWTAYSLAEVEREDGGRVIVRCLRYSATRGKRGIEIEDEPVVLVKRGDSYRIETD